jgi:hypothetical protein
VPSASRHATTGAARLRDEWRAPCKQRVWRKPVARFRRTASLIGRQPRRFRRTTVVDRHVQGNGLMQRQFAASAPDEIWFRRHHLHCHLGRLAVPGRAGACPPALPAVPPCPVEARSVVCSRAPSSSIAPCTSCTWPDSHNDAGGEVLEVAGWWTQLKVSDLSTQPGVGCRVSVDERVWRQHGRSHD